MTRILSSVINLAWLLFASIKFWYPMRSVVNYMLCIILKKVVSMCSTYGQSSSLSSIHIRIISPFLLVVWNFVHPQFFIKKSFWYYTYVCCFPSYRLVYPSLSCVRYNRSNLQLLSALNCHIFMVHVCTFIGMRIMYRPTPTSQSLTFPMLEKCKCDFINRNIAYLLHAN